MMTQVLTLGLCYGNNLLSQALEILSKAEELPSGNAQSVSISQRQRRTPARVMCSQP